MTTIATQVPAAVAGSRATRSPILRALKRPIPLTALCVLAVIVLAAVFAPLIAGDPERIVATERLRVPGARHWFGTDNLGRDVFARVVFGARNSLLVGLLVAALATAFGTVVGVLTGYFRRLDFVAMRVVDGLMAFPALVLAISMVGILGQSTTTVVAALATVTFPLVARVVRSSALVASRLPMIESARSVGAGHMRILLRYVLPSCWTVVLTQATVLFSVAVLAESGLSFIGAGLPPNVPSWGGSIADSRNYLVTAWWMTAFPGLALVATVLCLNLVTDALRDGLDPRIRER